MYYSLYAHGETLYSFHFLFKISDLSFSLYVSLCLFVYLSIYLSVSDSLNYSVNSFLQLAIYPTPKIVRLKLLQNNKRYILKNLKSNVKVLVYFLYVR